MLCSRGCSETNAFSVSRCPGQPAHFGMVSLLQLFFVQLDLGIVLLSHLMKGLSQLVLILNLTPRIHLYQASFMLPSGLINLLGRKQWHKTKLLTMADIKTIWSFTHQPPHVCPDKCVKRHFFAFIFIWEDFWDRTNDRNGSISNPRNFMFIFSSTAIYFS